MRLGSQLGDFDPGNAHVAMNDRGDVLVVWLEFRPARRPKRRNEHVVVLLGQIIRANGTVERKQRVGIADP